RGLDDAFLHAGPARSAHPTAAREAERVGEVTPEAVPLERLLDRAQAGRVERRRIDRGRRLELAQDLGRVRRLLGLGPHLLLLRFLGFLLLVLLGVGRLLVEQLHLLERAVVDLVVEEEDPTEGDDRRVEEDGAEDAQYVAELHFLSVLIPTFRMPILRTSSSR